MPSAAPRRDDHDIRSRRVMGDDDRGLPRPPPDHRWRSVHRGGLILAGIALLSIVTVSLASWLVDKVREV